MSDVPPGPGGGPLEGELLGGAAPPPTNPMAVASMVLGIAALVLAAFSTMCCACFGGLPALMLGPVAVVFGHTALRQVREPGARERGYGMAVAGLATGYTAIAVALVYLVAMLVLIIIGATCNHGPSFHTEHYI